MTNTLWIVQGILAFVFLLAGTMKLVQTREKVVSSGGKWAKSFSRNSIKMIGAAEVLFALGIILPAILGFDGKWTCAAAIGICGTMIGAFGVHFKRKEYPFLAVTATFALLAAFVIYNHCGAI